MARGGSFIAAFVGCETTADGVVNGSGWGVSAAIHSWNGWGVVVAAVFVLGTGAGLNMRAVGVSTVGIAAAFVGRVLADAGTRSVTFGLM